ncbi:EI24 domain-containing protein [Paracoccus sp. (in: a-proteobacteria)]|uniref:EI24 domain-containing protein n=1 Tax=Paracoccus sp. TaxID=267 RepID=UPI0026E0C350|nr:EI24 domain-containing protein [Paracoccus sp. (in: a-proteobacteria)]MDO5647944.1 EI24 domain-containing protein [Paracoccus sp. (in: a-proteobacteria)]
MISVLALMRGWGDVLRPAALRLALIGVGLTLALFAALQIALFSALRLLVPGGLSLPVIGMLDFGTILSWGSLALFPVLSIFLMAPVAAGFAGIFADNVADQVEGTHYPANQGQSLDLLDGFLSSLPVMGAVLLVAALSLILTPFLGPLTPILFYGANGWLLGREFFHMIARRHMDESQATDLRRRHAVPVTMAGVMIAFGLTVPVVNIVIPLLAAASFTHLFHMLPDYRTR